uniref:Uncharacterized protein n=1 Tax=Nelumbo nucifera TaxID=4432 RepID=A0A822Z6Q6_NELNU|nr:TPA_asm: hypothetical protein HUJ06_012968 [Nelumbo nucifera]
MGDKRLEARVCNSLRYYSAIFDSIDSALPLDSLVRIKVEEMYAREIIRNIVACEGNDRLERHESFAKWRGELLQSRMLLKMYAGDKYSVDKQGEEGAGLTLRWLEQPLYTVSVWAPIDVAGSPSISGAELIMGVILIFFHGCHAEGGRIPILSISR